MNRIQRPKSLTELAYEAIKQQIVTDELRMGEPLSEVKIAEKLAVSRTPVREAFARLELEGLVRTEPQRGTFVFTMDHEELGQICDTRVIFETGAFRQAFEKNAEGLLSALRTISQQMTEAMERQDSKTYLLLDTHFHQAIVDSADNRYLNEAYQTIASKMAALRNRLGGHPAHMEKSYREHLEMVELLAARDCTAFLEVLVAHIGRKEGSYWNV